MKNLNKKQKRDNKDPSNQEQRVKKIKKPKTAEQLAAAKQKKTDKIKD